MAAGGQGARRAEGEGRRRRGERGAGGRTWKRRASRHLVVWYTEPGYAGWRIVFWRLPGSVTSMYPSGISPPELP